MKYFRVVMLLIISVLLGVTAAHAQSENAAIRAGNRAFMDGEYTTAGVEYRGALLQNPQSVVGVSNLGSTLFRAGQYALADSLWQQTLGLQQSELAAQLQADSLAVPETTGLAGTHYNRGNAQLAQRQTDQKMLDEAIESYKESLRLNPRDENARYNLAYAMALKQKGDGGGDGGDNEGESDNEGENDEQNQNQDPENNQQKPDNQQDSSSEKAEKPESRKDAERMADAIQRLEDKTKEKVDKAQKATAAEGFGANQW